MRVSLPRATRPGLPGGASRLGLVALLALGCGGAPERPLDVLWIVSDTLRADALACAGGDARTPAICGLARRGVLFENAYANAPWTLPSSVSLFTGRHATAFAQPGTAGRDKTEIYFVPEAEELLAERLAAGGHRVVAFVENALVGKNNSLQGFASPDPQQPPGEPVLRLARQLGLDPGEARSRRLLPLLDFWLALGERPCFALQWFMDPHSVYAPPPRFLARLGVDPAAALPRPLEHYMRLGIREDPSSGRLDLRRRVDGMSPAERALVRSLYLREVESVDERVGLLLRALERLGRAERTLVVFTSDHGEGFGEHGLWLHDGAYAYEEFVRVPLIVAGPGVAGGRRVSDVVSHVDLVPTLAEWLGVEWAGAEARAPLPGRSLAPLLRGEVDSLPPRPAYIANRLPRGLHEALVDGDHKLIARRRRQELYDLRADPGERRDLAGERPELLKRLRARLAVEREAAASSRVPDPPPAAPALGRARRETLEQLRALGYAE